MTNPRKKIILNEILFWKQNKLLPEHYCDFLATLYTEGGDSNFAEEAKVKNAVLPAAKRKNQIYTVILTLLAGIIFAAMMIITVASWLIVGVAAIITLIIALRALKMENDSPVLAILSHITAALLVFGITVYISFNFFPENHNVLVGLLAFNCLGWLLVGIKKHLVYFTVSGALGFLLLVGYIIYMVL